MTYDELITLPVADLLSELQTAPTITRDKKGNQDYYNGEHAIKTDPDRQDFTVDIFDKDEFGNIKKDANGKPVKLSAKTITRARIVLSYPKEIIKTKVAMVAGNGIDIIDNSGDNTDQYNFFSDTFYNKLKVPSLMKQAIKTTGIETNCAIIFFFKNADPAQGIKAKILSHENGDEIYPYFDSDGDLIAFTRKFINKAVVEGAVTEQTIIQAYFADKMIESIDDVIEEKPNPFAKIPVVYFDQVYPEFKDAKDLITKQEYAVSQHYEVNRRIGNPPIVMQGDIVDMGDPSADTKVFKSKMATDKDGKNTFGDLKLLEASTAPESLKLQFDNIDNQIERASWMQLTRLIELAKGTGASGFAMQVALTDAFATRAAQISTFEDGMTRIISILKTMLSTTSGGAAFAELNVGFVFKPLLPDDIVTLTAVLSEAKMAGITSQSNAVNTWTFNENPGKVLEQIKQEENENT